MHFQTPINNTPSPYKNAMNGNWENTPMSNAFFSEQNQQILQNGIRAGVYKHFHGKFIISQQSQDDLKMIMRSMYLQHAENKPTHISEQISRLNQYVLDFCIPQVAGEAQGYMRYIHDVSTLSVPLSKPMSTFVKHNLEYPPFFSYK